MTFTVLAFFRFGIINTNINEIDLHTDEGPDDLPGHVKASIIGPSLTIPIKNGRLNVGTWQGIYLCEFREYQHRRTVVATINGLAK